MKLKLTSWSEEDVDRLKALIASGASAQRASVALRRSLSATKLKARDIGLPFPSERELRAKRRSILQNSVDAPRAFTRASGNRYE
jgi:GcrA cell cycle regulator